MVTDGDQSALLVDITSCDSFPGERINKVRENEKDLRHGDLERDVGAMLANVPESAQILGVNCGEEVVGNGSLITQDVNEA